ncbi:MAG: DUF2155 domain-containing protein [Bradyrhizobium sp.]
MSWSLIRLIKPREMLRIIALAGFAVFIIAAAGAFAPSAHAQFNTIFSNSPPRPPDGIPRGNQPYPDDDQAAPALPPGQVAPVFNRLPAPQQQGYAMPGPVQSQPLAPLPGTTVAPQNRPPAVAVAPPQPGQDRAMQLRVNPLLPGLPPGQRQPRGVPQSPPLEPGDEVVVKPPPEKIINKRATFTGLDKITGRTINFDEAIGETVQFGALRIKTDACYTRPPTERANTDAFVEVDEITLKGEVKRIFSGWMFAASPGLHAVDHPIYDVWLTGCKDPETTLVSAAPTAQPKKPVPQRAQKRTSSRRATRPPVLRPSR